jgi:hypothetical protein
LQENLREGLEGTSATALGTSSASFFCPLRGNFTYLIVILVTHDVCILDSYADLIYDEPLHYRAQRVEITTHPSCHYHV